MSRVIYDEKRLIPAPLVSITKSYQKSGNGEIVGKIFNLTITGTIVAWMGSPMSDGSFWESSGYPPDEDIAAENRLGAIQRKQEAIRHLFSVEGKSFEIQSSISDTPVRCNPRIVSIDFAQGIWYDRCDYTITLECDELYGDVLSDEDLFLQYISDAQEQWTIDTNEDNAESFNIPRTYSLSHTVSAQGKRFYNELGELLQEPWEYAKNFVLSKIGLNSNIISSSGINNLPSYYKGLNHVRNENIDKQGGNYSVTENWVLASGYATETFSVNISNELESQYKTVSIEGSVNGYEERDGNLNILSSKWENAYNKYASISGVMFIRAQQFSGMSLNIVPLSETVGHNPIQGTIDYSFEYNGRPMNIIDGAKSESIVINDNIGGQLFASVFVLGRLRGPVLQDLNTKPANTRSLSIEIVVPAPYYTDNSISTVKGLINSKKPSSDALYSASITNVINAANPLNNGFTTVFQSQPQESWDFKEGRYSYQCEWTYE
jgi:hypothetical protein